MKNFAVFFAVLFAMGGANASAKKASVPLEDVLKNPHNYHEKIIEVVGVATIEFEGTALYLDQGAQSGSNYDKGIWLEVAGTSFNDKKYTGKRVAVKGKFSETNKGHFGAWKGALEGISKLEILKADSKK